MPSEMRKWKYCANFIADYLDYKTLHPPGDCPKQLPAINSILRTRKGNSLEISMVLCTFLLASDYEAYVVQGYATRYICEKVESEKSNPTISFVTKSEYHKSYCDSLSSKEEAPKPNTYQLDFLRLKNFWMEGKTSEFKESKREVIEEKKVEEDVLQGKRVHFWVLLCFVKNDSVHSFFIEATTGEKKPVNDPEYLGIEFVWNDKNFWCNNQSNEGSCSSINFDFDNRELWEAFLPDYTMEETQISSMISKFRMPGTWVKDIEISDEDINNRFPLEGKHIQYKNAKLDKYNPNALRDGLVYRMTYYKMDNLADAEISQAFYANRKDLLEYRITNFSINIVTERFSRGRNDALKEHIYPLKNNSFFPQTMNFYYYLRKDKLSIRKWTENMTTDYFEGRADLLQSREVHYLPEERTEESSHLAEEMKDTTKISYEKKATPKEISSVSELETSSTALDELKEERTTEKPEESITQVSELESSSMEKVDKKEVSKDTDVKFQVDTSLSSKLCPNSFESVAPLLEDEDFTSWKFEDFLNRLDPSERYATSESDTEITDTQKSKSLQEDEIEVETEDTERIAEDEIENLPSKQGKLESQDDTKTDDEDINEDEKMDLQKPIPSQPDATDEQDAEEGEGEFDMEMEIYDEINFDALSDEELEIDYQLFLSKIWKEYFNLEQKDLFYMTREFHESRDLRSRQALRLKKKIMQKRRRNVRYIERLEKGKPKIRVYKKKSTEKQGGEKSICTDDFIVHLNLKDSLGIQNASSLKEFHLIEELEKDYLYNADGEVIKKEAMKLLDRKLMSFRERNVLNKGKCIIIIKSCYIKEPSLPVDSAIRSIWFFLQTDNYRIDFHYPEGKSSCKTLIFSKPESGSSEFRFADHLCRQILPSYDTKKICRPRLYSYLVTLLKLEPLVLRDHSKFEIEMQKILDIRKEEEGKIELSEEKRPSEEEHFAKMGIEPQQMPETVQKVKDCVSYTMKKFNFSTPLTVEESRKVYNDIFDEFCDRINEIKSELKRDFDNATDEYKKFLEECKSWNGDWTKDRERRFSEACGRFYGLMSSIQLRCETQYELVKSNYMDLKWKLYHDPRLSEFIKIASENYSNS